MQWDVQELSFVQSRNRLALGEACAARAAVCCGLSISSHTLNQCEAATHTHTHTHTHIYMHSVFSCYERGKCRKKRRAVLLRLLAAFLLSERWPTFMPGKKKACAADCENLLGLGGNGGK